MHPALSTAIAVLVALVLGTLFQLLHLPLAWLLGPLIGSAIVSLSGFKVVAPTRLRRLGQMVVGTSIGLHVTAAIAASLVIWFPIMVATALLSVAISGVLSVLLARFARIDEITAYYAMLPGGLAEMANIGAGDGARPEPIALSQALRVALVVLVMPPIIVAIGIDQGVLEANTANIAWWMVLPLLAVAGIGVAVVTLLRMQNGWMVGALVAVGTVSALGWPNGQMLPVVFAAAQFVIGVNVGARFQREQIRRLPRVALVSTIMVLAMSAVLFGVAWLMTLPTGLDIATAALALSPGGMAEMAATAQVLHLGIVLVTGFHVVRAITVNAFGRPLRGVLEGSGLLPLARRLLGGG